jgi:transcription elongation factor Elf1
MGKLTTPDWILKGKKKPTEKKKEGKKYKVKKCPKCGSTEVSIVLVGEEGKKADSWVCRACMWKGSDIKEGEMSEDEFLEHLAKMEGK